MSTDSAEFRVDIREYNQEILLDNIAAGNTRRFGPDHLPKDVDCGDRRKLTEQSNHGRIDIPARYFGTSSGLAVTALTALIMQKDDGVELANEWLHEFEGGIAEIAGTISHLAKSRLGIHVNVHSDTSKEKSNTRIVPGINEELGCKFNSNYGKVVKIAGSLVVMEEAKQVTEFSDRRGFAKDTEEAVFAFRELLPILGGPDAKVSREEIIPILRNKKKMTPVVNLDASSTSAKEPNVVIDMFGYKSLANGRDFHHSLIVPELILPTIFPEFHFDSPALRASGLVMGLATQHALGVRQTLVIPENHLILV